MKLVLALILALSQFQPLAAAAVCDLAMATAQEACPPARAIAGSLDGASSSASASEVPHRNAPDRPCFFSAVCSPVVAVVLADSSTLVIRVTLPPKHRYGSSIFALASGVSFPPFHPPIA